MAPLSLGIMKRGMSQSELASLYNVSEKQSMSMVKTLNEETRKVAAVSGSGVV
jgi:transposase